MSTSNRLPRQLIRLTPGVRFGITFAAFALYVLVFLLLNKRVGLSITSASLVPVAVAGWLYGARMGVLAGLFTIPLNVALYAVIGLPDPLLYIQRGGLIGSLFDTVIGFAIGRFHDLNLKVEQARNDLERRVTERTAELAQANKALERSLVVKDEFMANMSHELRTPLNAILGFATVLEMGIETDVNAQKELLGSIKANGTRLLTLINDVLDLAKIEAQQMRVTMSFIKPRVLIENTLNDMRSLAQAKNLKLDVQVMPGLPPLIECDGQKVQQIVTNLVSNAIKFTDQGHVNVILSANAQDGGETPSMWSIAVEDTGVGIAPADATYIFDAFRQVDGTWTRQNGGTGLGLAIVKRFTDLLGGSVTVQSEVDKGSTFTVTLPLVNRTSSELATPSAGLKVTTP